MKQEFEVIEVENMRMRLAQPKQGCNHCSLNSGCGVGILGKYLSKPLPRSNPPNKIASMAKAKPNLIYFKSIFLTREEFFKN